MIPEDVQKAAEVVAADIATKRFKTSHLIARAILAERQRCADVARKWADDNLQSGEVRLVAAYIDREIRKPPTP